MAVGDVEVINTLGPKNDGAFPIARALEILGGYKSVADATARDAIPVSRREEGMLVRTNDDGKTWLVDAGLATWTEFSGGGPSAFMFAKTYADLAALSPTDPDEIKHVMVADPTGDPDPVTPIDGMPVIYVWWENSFGAVWNQRTLLGNLSTQRTATGGTVIQSVDGGSMVFPSQMKVSQLVNSGLGCLLNFAGEVRLGGTLGGQQSYFTTPNGEVSLPVDDATSGKISALVGGPYASISAAIKKALTSNTKVSGSRFLGITTPQTIFVDPTTGNDTTGTGLTALTAYATIQRAIDDIPDRYTTDVIIQLAAGTYAGQYVSITLTPGFTSSGNQPNIYILGATTAAYQGPPLQPINTNVSGKFAQWIWTVTHGLTITDGSHWVLGGGALPTTVRTCRASGATQVIIVQTSSTTLTSPRICAWNTTFNTTFRIGCQTLSPLDAPFVHLVGIKFTALSFATRVSLNACSVTTLAPVIQDCNLFGSHFSVDISLFDNSYGRRITTGCLFNARLLHGGPRSTLQGCVFAATLAVQNSMLLFGTSAQTEPPYPSNCPSGARLFSQVDFEGTGNAISLANGSYLQCGSGSVSFAITGRAFFLDFESWVTSGPFNTAFTGTVTLPSKIQRGSRWHKANLTYSAANVLNVGQDFDVGGGGAGGTVIAASSTYADLTDVSVFA